MRIMDSMSINKALMKIGWKYYESMILLLQKK